MKKFCFAWCIALIIYTSRAFGSEAGMPQLNPEFWAAQIFWLVLIFISLYLIVGKIFLPKITHSIENRKSRIVNDLDEAQKINENAEKKLKEYNDIIEKSKKEAKKIIENSRKKLDKDIENKKENFDNEIEKEIAVVEREIDDLKKSSISNINNISTEISAEVIRQIIGIEVNKSSTLAIVNEIVKKKVEKQL